MPTNDKLAASAGMTVEDFVAFLKKAASAPRHPMPYVGGKRYERPIRVMDCVAADDGEG